MISVLMLDLGDTLVHNNVVFPHVPDALRAFQSFITVDDEPLEMCLVSDFLDAIPPTDERIQEIFQQYIAILEGFGIARFFKPADERITLSTHAGIRKPDAKIFQLAISRLGVNAQLSNCLFITENVDHIEACKNELGMATLRFDASPDVEDADFHDWMHAPRLVADRIGGDIVTNADAALGAVVSAERDIEDLTIVERNPQGRLRASGTVLQSLRDAELGEYDGVCVGLPVDLEIQVDEHGNLQSVDQRPTSPLDQQEAAMVLKGLIESNSIAANRHDAGKTHVIETERKRRVLRRIGFD